LLVDDSEPIRTRLCCLLESIPGITSIDQADTLATALQCMRRSVPALVVLDLYLPDGMGLDIIATLKQMAPDLRIAVLTLHGKDSYRQMCLVRGADWFFDKACEFDSLLDVVRQQVAQQAVSQVTQEIHHALD
jgi:DNA-binding NarL/FixJ family response regulator